MGISERMGTVIFILEMILEALSRTVFIMIIFVISSSRFPMSPRPDSVHSTTSSSDSHDSEENYVPMNPNLSGEDSVCKVFILTSLFFLPVYQSYPYIFLYT